jgi:hypothetical protein
MRKLVMADPEAQPTFDFITKGIRTLTLQKLILLLHILLYDYNSEVPRAILERARKKQPWLSTCRVNILSSVKPKDIMQILGCSRRVAVDYMKTLRMIANLTP